MNTFPVTEAGKVFGSLVRRAASAGERITITDHGHPAAVLVSAQELADLEEALALAEYKVDHQADGRPATVPQQEVRARLGLDPG